LGDRKGIRPVKKTGRWFVGGDDLTGALHDLQLQLSPPPPSSFALINTAIPGSAGKWPLKRREREGEQFERTVARG